MAFIRVGSENSTTVDLYYEDHGSGAPVVLIHGFPLSGHAWEKQAPALLNAGFRVIIYDRRGFGRSSQPASGYEYDTFAHDLHTLMTTLDLRDTALVGHAMGVGEVIRYLATYGPERVSAAAALAPLPPFLLRTADNPNGVPAHVFDQIREALAADRPAYLADFLNAAYNMDVLRSERVSDEAIRMSWLVAVGASAKGTLDCVATWFTDFRPDLSKIALPLLIVQGDADRILPIRATGERLAAMIKGAQFEIVASGPHMIGWTHAEEVNRALLDFLGR